MNKNTGFTIIELLVTMAISAMLMTYTMMVFTDLGKGFRMQGEQSKKVLAMILAKKQIDKSLSTIGSIDSWTTTTLRYKKFDSDTIVNVQFRDLVLLSDSKQVCKDIKDFKFKVEENSSTQNSKSDKNVLLWECGVGKNGIIAGAVIIGE